mgnify:CR=1 FL=1
MIFKIEIFIPKKYINKIIEASNKLGACKVGEYDYVSSYYEINGSFRPLEGSEPYDGKKNEINFLKECKLEIRCEEKFLKKVIKRIKEIHPYEEPVVNIIKLYNDLI